MSERQAYERLELLVKRRHTLPPLPATVLRLVRVIDTGEASAIDLEKVVSCDPPLTADLLRAALMTSSEDAPTTTIRGAIMRLGQKAVRSMGVSLLMNDLMTKYGSVTGFDPVRLATHSLFVGYMSRFLFVRKHALTPFHSRWSAEEIFAAGVMHDLPVGVMAIVSPSAVARVSAHSRRSNMTFAQGFEEIFGEKIHRLGSVACNTWGLPEIFEQTQLFFDEPWAFDQEITALYCLNYANFLAESNGFALESYEPAASVLPEAKLEVGLDEEEVANAVEVVSKLTRSTLGTNYLAA